MYKFMHVCMNVCISLYTYVGVHACMCVGYVQRMSLSMSKRKQICCKEIPTFYRQARFLLRLQILPRQLPHLPYTQLRHCRLTKSVLQLKQKNYVRPLKFGGAKSFLFRDLGGGLAPPSPYVEPPLHIPPISTQFSNSPIFAKCLHFLPIPAKFSFLCIIHVFASTYFVHDAFMHRAFHELDAPE